MKTETEKFYVIATGEGTFVHYRDDGNRDEAWGDVLTAERFYTRKDAKLYIKYDADHSPDNYTIKQVTVRVSVR